MTLQVIGSGETPSSTKLNAISRQTHITASTSQRTGMSGIPAGLHCYDTSLGLDFVWDGSNWKLWAGRVRAEMEIPSGNRQTLSNATTEDLTWVTNPAPDNSGGIDWWPSHNHVLYAPYKGVYSMQCSIYLDAGIASGYIKFVRGGSVSDYATETIPANASEHHMCLTGVNMEAGDTFKFQVRQTSSPTSDRLCAARLTATYMTP